MTEIAVNVKWANTMLRLRMTEIAVNVKWANTMLREVTIKS